MVESVFLTTFEFAEPMAGDAHAMNFFIGWRMYFTEYHSRTRTLVVFSVKTVEEQSGAFDIELSEKGLDFIDLGYTDFELKEKASCASANFFAGEFLIKRVGIIT